MPVVDEAQNTVDRGVGVGQIYFGEDGGDALIAAGIAREDGREQLGRDLREVGGGRWRDKGESGDSHAMETIAAKWRGRRKPGNE